MTPDPQAAPGDLEQVRELLNSWLVPNDTRQPIDRFDEYARGRRIPRPHHDELRRLRDDLRAIVERGAEATSNLNRWLARLRVRPTVAAGRVGFDHAPRAAGEIAATVLRAMSDGLWPRLKACPDCRWVFYDHTRNGAKRWCLMNAGAAGGRGCGTIAKVQRYRERQRAGERAPRSGAAHR
jgi:predicted RNA-binding Zn ribbon-like protein